MNHVLIDRTLFFPCGNFPIVTKTPKHQLEIFIVRPRWKDVVLVVHETNRGKVAMKSGCATALGSENLRSERHKEILANVREGPSAREHPEMCDAPGIEVSGPL